MESNVEFLRNHMDFFARIVEILLLDYAEHEPANFRPMLYVFYAFPSLLSTPFGRPIFIKHTTFGVHGARYRVKTNQIIQNILFRMDFTNFG